MTGRVLVANRGEIALRIIRAAKDLGLETVAVYSDADSLGLPRFMADYAVRLPGNTSAETYLDIDKMVKAIKDTSATLVHPGFGFLSENADFAEAVAAAGAIFAGPPADAISKMGDKVQARELMQKAGVPTVPGSEDPLEKWEDLKALADDIGYPLIIKAAAGGGGRGMRVVREQKELQAAFEACTREAQSYFGNPAVFCERYLDTARHIEIQIMFDKHGNGVHLFERDCSIQRRHQKLLEEAPSLFLNPEQRARLGEIAIQAGKAVNYVGAGTVEFICESPDKCYFMEMNTRIQVEHPVTEMITGIDLVAEQLKVAQGEKLSFAQDDLQVNGWAIEARINAEDPERDFMPSPGLVERLRLPQGPFVRVETHLYPGYKIPEFYDSMIAKVVVWGRSRDEARMRMLRALSEMRVEGVPTTAAFHEALVQHRDFCSGEFTTGFLEKEGKKLSQRPELANDAQDVSAAFAAIAAQTYQQRHISRVHTSDRAQWRQAARKPEDRL